MAKTRLALHNLLCKILGSSNVYFSPPSGFNMKYPCIRYRETKPSVEYADNIKYLKRKSYSLIFISADPDSDIPDRILSLPYCSSDRKYESNNLNHWTFTLYW